MIVTERLRLRDWQQRDRAPFAAMSADPAVMAYLGGCLDAAAVDAVIARMRAHFAANGFGMWVLERRDDGSFAGMAGLARPRYRTPFTPCVEIGWRLVRCQWGRGLATEAARAVLDHGFAALGLDEIVAMAVPANARSLAVMHRLGMTRDPADDFDHPLIAAGSPLRRHVLYRLPRAAWQAQPARRGAADAGSRRRGQADASSRR